MVLKIAIIGSRGIPAKYGGFETFVDEISRWLVDKGYEVYVSCEGGGETPKILKYNGAFLFYFPLRPFCRVVYETIYDVYSLIKSSFICDYVYMLGHGAGFFFFIPRLFKKKLFVNVDGLEWRRDKYNKIEKFVLYLSEIFAVHLSDVIIADSTEIKKYIELKHRKTAVYISYGVNQPPVEMWDPTKLNDISGTNFQSIESNSYYLVVARLEPENNIHTIIEGFLISNTINKLIIVGNFSSRKYEQYIHKIINKLNGHDRVIFTKGIYKADLLNMLRQNCFVYIHGHSAGGTNPSLLEAMAMNTIVIAHDNIFNKEVGCDSLLYFKDPNDLKNKIEYIQSDPLTFLQLKNKASKRVLDHYSWDKIANEYDSLFKMYHNLTINKYDCDTYENSDS